jgi:uncharacterized protein (DUF1501 family)
MMQRRDFLKYLSAAGTVGMGAGLGMMSLNSRSTTMGSYKALVVIHLNGGNDSNDVLVPMDGAFTDYQNARASIAVAKSNLSFLSNRYLGHTFGLNSAMSPLLPLFNNGKLAFIANAGPLIKPTTVSEVLNGTATLPPFLFSHPEQTRFVQGWLGDVDPSGWGGRAIEALSGSKQLKSPLVSIDSGAPTVVLGQKSRILNATTNFSNHIGRANLTDRNNKWTQIMESITRLQSPVDVENEYARSFRAVFMDSSELAQAEKVTKDPSGKFEDNDIAKKLRFMARVMPFYRSAGATRQIYSLDWGRFDTHSGQRNGNNANNDLMGQDAQLAELSKALVAFDASLQSAGLGNEVALLVTSEFGRTLDPAAGNGSDHAWGSHWMVMGNMVGGNKIYGQSFPRLILGGVDDAHDGRRGYWAPQYSSDQVAADLLLWLGLPNDKLTLVMPNLVNFNQKTVGFMNV